MEFTIIYDNTVLQEGLTPDWGFAGILKTDENEFILFDTGADGHILESNCRELGFSLSQMDYVVISHNHFDHIGGLAQTVHRNLTARYIIPSSLRGLKRPKTIIEAGPEPVQVTKTIYTTGEMAGIEQSLVIAKDNSVIVITGCSHPGLSAILDKASDYGKVKGIIGGFHDFSEIEKLKAIPFICPTHCTERIEEIQKRYPGAYRKGGAGAVINITNLL